MWKPGLLSPSLVLLLAWAVIWANQAVISVFQTQRDHSNPPANQKQPAKHTFHNQPPHHRAQLTPAKAQEEENSSKNHFASWFFPRNVQGLVPCQALWDAAGICTSQDSPWWHQGCSEGCGRCLLPAPPSPPPLFHPASTHTALLQAHSCILAHLEHFKKLGCFSSLCSDGNVLIPTTEL